MWIKWLHLALKDIDQIAEFISQNNPSITPRIINEIRQNTQKLIDHPNIGRPGRVSGTRELVIKGLPFLIPYRIKNQEIQILRVLHSSREWPDSF